MRMWLSAQRKAEQLNSGPQLNCSAVPLISYSAAPDFALGKIHGGRLEFVGLFIVEEF